MNKVGKPLEVLAFGCVVGVLLAACGGGGGGGGTTAATAVVFTTGQAASVAIGQPDMNSGTPNQGGSTAANTLSIDSPSSPNNFVADPFVNAGTLFLPDPGNNRTLVYSPIPAVSDANATYAIGQSALTSAASGTSASAVQGPTQTLVSAGNLIVVESLNNRVDIYNGVPSANNPNGINRVVGETSNIIASGGCGANLLDGPRSAVTAGNKLIVADTNNNRVLIWNSIPMSDGASADVALGQSSTSSCSSGAPNSVTGTTLYVPDGVWSDGSRLVVADTGNNRVLVWNSIPTSNNQAPSLVLGQSGFGTAASGTGAATNLNGPRSVYFNTAQLFVADTGNNRVLVWNSFPIYNGQAADVVLGQSAFGNTNHGTTANSMYGPAGLFLYGKQLFVGDMYNNRYLIFNGQ